MSTDRIKENDELTEKELDEVKAGRSNQEDWCPKVDTSKKKTDDDELTLEELDKVKAGRNLTREEIKDQER